MTTFQRVRKVLSESLSVDECDIEPVSSLRADLNADSLEIAQLIIELEDEFGFEIPQDDVENIFTVADIVKYADSRSAA